MNFSTTATSRLASFRPFTSDQIQEPSPAALPLQAGLAFAEALQSPRQNIFHRAPGWITAGLLASNPAFSAGAKHCESLLAPFRAATYPFRRPYKQNIRSGRR